MVPQAVDVRVRNRPLCTGTHYNGLDTYARPFFFRFFRTSNPTCFNLTCTQGAAEVKTLGGGAPTFFFVWLFFCCLPYLKEQKRQRGRAGREKKAPLHFSFDACFCALGRLRLATRMMAFRSIVLMLISMVSI